MKKHFSWLQCLPMLFASELFVLSGNKSSAHAVLVNLIIRFCQMREKNWNQNEKMPHPGSVCAWLCLISFSFMQQIVFICLRFTMNSSSCTETDLKLPVNCYKCTNWNPFVLSCRFGRVERIFILVSPLWWHWTLFPLPADGCCSFHYQGEAAQDFFSCCWFTTD